VTQDQNNDAKNSDLHHRNKLKYYQIENDIYNISQYYRFTVF